MRFDYRNLKLENYDEVNGMWQSSSAVTSEVVNRGVFSTPESASPYNPVVYVLSATEIRSYT